MKVTVQLLGQLGDAAGAARRTVTLDRESDAQSVVRMLSDELGAPFRDLVFENGVEPRACVLLFVGSQRVDWNEPFALADGDEILLATPIAGG